MKNPLKIFVDTDAFVALIIETDSNHKKAVALLNNLCITPVVFFTSNYVFSESITIIRMEGSHAASLQFIETMQSFENPFQIKRADAATEELAIHLFKKQTAKNTNYVDCINMALIKQQHADAVFSFDDVYKKNGLQLAENLI